MLTLNFRNITLLGLFSAMAFVNTSCGVGGPNPGKDPDETIPNVTHTYVGQGNRTDVNIKDSLITIYAGGGTVASEIILSVRKADLNKGNDVKFDSEALSVENVKDVRNGLLFLHTYTGKNTQILPPEGKFLGKNKTGKLGEIKIQNMGIVGLRGGPDGDDYAIKRDQVEAILKLAKEQVALVGKKVIMGQNEIDLKVTN